MIHFSCDSCKKILRAADDRSGHLGRCPSCKSRIKIPLSSISAQSDDCLDEIEEKDDDPVKEEKIKGGGCSTAVTIVFAELLCGIGCFITIISAYVWFRSIADRDFYSIVGLLPVFIVGVGMCLGGLIAAIGLSLLHQVTKLNQYLRMNNCNRKD